MDTVSMLNNMRFYCQPILPLVYDESISYYETLCKVVGQLNTTGDEVKKLNEGLTGEIAARQAADTVLDERLKLIEEANKRIHFLVFVGANPNSSMPTRTELWNWVRNGDIICALYSANDTERGDVYAASCTYNAGNWSTENSSDFHFLIPLETTYDSTGKLAVKQKIVKLTIPSYTEHVLTVPWGKETIEINTPHTSAEGIVNFSATVDNNNTVHANLSPAEFTSLYRTVSKGSGLIVGINAQLTTNDSQLLLSTSADINGGETAADDEVRIVFDAETYIGERGLDLPYLTRPIYILVGSGTDETWTLTKFKTQDFAFDRDEGFQFTRAANNVITPSFGSTPKEVAEYFGTVKGGVPYQNLPVHLIDNVDNAEYWNGVFDRKSDGRISYTFTTSYYRQSKMLVRIIELSATPKSGNTFAGDEKWVYAAKEFELPFAIDTAMSDTSTNAVQNKVIKKYVDDHISADVYVDFWPTGTEEEYNEIYNGYQVELATDQTFDSIFDSIKAGNTTVARLYDSADKSDSPIHSVDSTVSGDKELGTINFQFASAGTGNVAGFSFIGETIVMLKIGTHTPISLVANHNVLPTPNSDGTDNGKVPTINGTAWELKTPSGGGSTNAVLYTQQTLTDEQKKQARDNVDAAIGDFQVTATVQNFPACTLDKTFNQIQEAISKGKRVFARLNFSADNAFILELLSSTSTEIQFTAFDYNYGLNKAQAYKLVVSPNKSEIAFGAAPTLTPEDTLHQVEMAAGPSFDMEIATKKYVDDHSSSSATKVMLAGTIEGEVEGYTSTTFQQIKDEIAKNRNIWLTIDGETIRMASYKTSYNQSVVSYYKLVFFGAGDGALTVKYEVTASASSASLTVTGS